MLIPHTCIRVDSSSLIYNYFTFITGIHFRLLFTMLEEVFWELPFDFGCQHNIGLEKVLQHTP